MWDDLRAHHARTGRRRFETLFDDRRAKDFSVRVGDMLFDFSKTNIDAEARALLLIEHHLILG